MLIYWFTPHLHLFFRIFFSKQVEKISNRLSVIKWKRIKVVMQVILLVILSFWSFKTTFVTDFVTVSLLRLSYWDHIHCISYTVLLKCWTLISKQIICDIKYGIISQWWNNFLLFSLGEITGNYSTLAMSIIVMSFIWIKPPSFDLELIFKANFMPQSSNSLNLIIHNL